MNILNLGLLSKLRRIFANGYINRRFGTNRTPAVQKLSIFADFLPIKSVMDSQFRYLPKSSKGLSLLYIGCGNGYFLVNANEMGWTLQV